MADLIQMDTDEEIDKYDEATLIASNPPPLATTKNKMAVYNPLNGRNDVLVPLSLGGYVKLGEEPVDRLAEVRKYADELQQMEQPFDMADYEAAGFTQREVEDAGIMPVTQEKTGRTEPLREGEELRMRREGAAMVTPDDPTMREDLTRLTFENTEGDLRQIFEVLGIDRFTARKMAEGLWGNPESTRDLGLGVADFTPAGLFFGAQEGMRTFERGRNTGDPLTIGMGALEAGLSFLEALPLTAAGAKGLKASMPAMRNALTELGRRMNQPGDMPTTSSFGVGAIDDLVIRDIEKIYAVDRPDIVKDMFGDDETAALVLGELRADDPLADAASLNELQNVRSELYNQTQSRLANLPDEITVYRAGDLNENDGISSFTLNPNYNPNLQLPWNELRGSPRLKAYTVKKSDILATPDLIRDFGEGEVIIRNSSVQLAPIDDAKPSAAELRRQANIQRFGYDPNEAPVDTSYRMEHQPTGPGGGEGIRLDNLTKNISGEQAGYPEDFYTPDGQRIYAQGPSFEGDEYGMANQESYEIIKSVRGNPEAEVTIYRAVPNEDAITSINPGDFVTLSPKYAELHGASGYGRSGDEAGKVLEQKVKVKDIYWDGNDVNEFGYFPKNVATKQSLQDDLRQKYPDVTLDVSGDAENGYELNRIVVPESTRGEGVGTQVMQDMIDMADQQGAKIALTPDKSFGGTSVARLKKFYKQFGFVENKGRNKDFSIRNTMYRNPAENK